MPTSDYYDHDDYEIVQAHFEEETHSTTMIDMRGPDEFRRDRLSGVSARVINVFLGKSSTRHLLAYVGAQKDAEEVIQFANLMRPEWVQDPSFRPLYEALDAKANLTVTIGPLEPIEDATRDMREESAEAKWIPPMGQETTANTALRTTVCEFCGMVVRVTQTEKSAVGACYDCQQGGLR